MSIFGMHSVLQGLKATRLKNAVAAGVTNITDATVVDMANQEGVIFIIPLGAVVDGTAAAVQIHGSDLPSSAFGLMKDDAGNDCTYTIKNDDDNKVILIEVYRPRNRYVRPIINRATENVTVDGVIALTFQNRSEPISATPPATIATRSRFISPKKSA
jgi:hypothetical protein